MKKDNVKPRTDKEREEQRCGGCDCFETEDGCECRIVSCSQCGNRDNLYNMHHDLFHTDYWFDGMPFYQKLSEIICRECYERGNEEETSESEDD